MNCANCGKSNRSGSTFCQYCGHKLDSGLSGESTIITRQPAPPPPPAVAYQPPSVSRSASGTPTGGFSPAQRSLADLPMGGAGSQVADIWGPFAGYGNRGHHASWLLDGLADSANLLHQAVSARFKQRKIPLTITEWRTLTGKGVQVERRPFFIIQRGITTVALYIGRFGHDLYISQVTYAKGPISNFRVIILGLMILFQLFFIYGYGATLNDMFGRFSLFGGGPDAGDFLFMICFLGPLGLLNTMLLGLALLYSIYNFLRDKDFLAILRTPPNEFQLDDIVALEKSVEESVRQSLDEIGIDSALMPPKPEHRELYRKRLI